jgi:molecular chaperone IbpA
VPLVPILLVGGSGYAHVRLLPLCVRPSVSTAFSTSLKPPSAPARTTTPYNIERLDDDRYQISLAVAGFAPDDMSVTAEQNVVTIEGTRLTRQSTNICIGAFRPALQATIQSRGLCPGEERSVREWLAEDRVIREIPPGHEGARRIAINGAAASTVHQLEGKAA